MTETRGFWWAALSIGIGLLVWGIYLIVTGWPHTDIGILFPVFFAIGVSLYRLGFLGPEKQK